MLYCKHNITLISLPINRSSFYNKVIKLESAPPFCRDFRFFDNYFANFLCDQMSIMFLKWVSKTFATNIDESISFF